MQSSDPRQSSAHHDHPNHHHGHASADASASGVAHTTHTMPDGTVMEGASCDHEQHDGHDHAAHGHDHHAHHRHAAAPKAMPKGDQNQVEYTCPMHHQYPKANRSRLAFFHARTTNDHEGQAVTS
ncbi:MAG: hypothetical protein HZB72_15425 [Burkholderiales bacterium]|nr:hypothetical protein [Burkholderiales bacterium]